MDRVILVGVGGATCSGKTTLAKHLKQILPDSVIIHQDDFAPPQEQVPFHPVYKVQDWDRAEGAIQWPRLISFLQDVKKTGRIPEDHRSHDHLNEQKDVPIDDETGNRWKTFFEDNKQKRKAAGEARIVWGLVDGFLLYWHPEVRDQLDVRFFLRVPETTLKHRRHERHGYHTAGKATLQSSSVNPDVRPHFLPPLQFNFGVQSDPEGSLWRDPPHYWEQIVWPAYVDANKGLFVDENIEGEVAVEGIEVIEGLQSSMSQIVDRCCKLLESFACP